MPIGRPGAQAPQRFKSPSSNEALGGRDQRVLARARRPAEQAPGLVAGRVPGLAEFANDLPDGRDGERGEAQQPVGQFAGRHAARRGAQASLQGQRNFAHAHEVARDREKALALGARVGHGPQVQIRHVAHVDDAEA